MTISTSYAVFGHPVSHSLSPRIHAAFARQTGVAMDYRAIDVEDFDGALQAFAEAGGVGANVTLPHKHRAAALCSGLSDRARRAGAVNTMMRVDTGWHGDNTDGAGLVRNLTGRYGLDLRGRRTLLLGAGGGAHGVAPDLLDAGIADLYIVNRTPERADALADALGEPGRVHPRYLEDVASLGEFELIINATSAARSGAFPSLPMSLAGRRTTAVDLSYGEASIAFLAWARAAGCRDVIDGLGMLVEQAAESFALWHGVRPETDAIYAELRTHDAELISAD
ncbi:MAG: shikimate dehydrogenase [Luteimonas sp.]